MFSLRQLSLFALVAILFVTVEAGKTRFPLAKKKNDYGAGVYQNDVMFKTVQAQAKKLVGLYNIKNVANGGSLAWATHPQSIFTSKTIKQTITLSNYGPGTRVKPTASNNKCLAAQFSGAQGVDNAGTMYACNTLNTKPVDAGDPVAKQQWHFVPVTDRVNTYYIIPHDHLDDMITRALGPQPLRTAGNYRSLGIELFDEKSTSQMWVVTKA